MSAILGYFLCVLALTPALSLEVFFGVIGRSTRQHDLLELFRFAVQMAVGVTSPFKLAMVLAVITGVFIAGSSRPARGAILFAIAAAVLLAVMHLSFMFPSLGFRAAVAFVPSIAATFVSLSGATRLLTCTLEMC
jgi:hypothetical protein